MVDLLKFTFNKKILNRVVALIYNHACCQILSRIFYVGPKKNLGWSKSFFKDKEIINF